MKVSVSLGKVKPRVDRHCVFKRYSLLRKKLYLLPATTNAVGTSLYLVTTDIYILINI
jgi:hypothetical protein